MKKFGFLSVFLVVFLSLMVTSATSAADNPIGWKIVFQLDNGQKAEIGANNLAGGFSLANQNYVGNHIGIDANGTTGGRIFINTGIPVAETVYIWNNSPSANTGQLSWQWYNYDPLWQSYRLGSKPVNIVAAATLITPWGRSWQALDVNTGSSALALTQNANYDYDSYRIVFTASPVPEPGSLLALGSGLIGLIGFGLRRRR